MRIEEFQLSTDRLILRPHLPDDADFMVELNSDPLVVRYTGDGALSGPVEARRIIIDSLHRQFRETRIGRLIVIEKKTGEKIGWCGLKRLPESGKIDLGYRFLRRSWGKGFATEASSACLKYGFLTLRFERITATVEPANAASARVLQKLGMIQCGSGLEDGRELLEFAIEKKDFDPTS